jgi:hypothetical protein
MSFFGRLFTTPKQGDANGQKKAAPQSTSLTSEHLKVEGHDDGPVDEERKSTFSSLLSNSLGVKEERG